MYTKLDIYILLQKHVMYTKLDIYILLQKHVVYTKLDIYILLQKHVMSIIISTCLRKYEDIKEAEKKTNQIMIP
jgi:hypothetical protein